MAFENGATTMNTARFVNVMTKLGAKLNEEEMDVRGLSGYRTRVSLLVCCIIASGCGSTTNALRTDRHGAHHVRCVCIAGFAEGS